MRRDITDPRQCPHTAAQKEDPPILALTRAERREEGRHLR